MDDSKMRECPICKLKEAKTVSAKPGSFGTIITINCPRCKEFTIAHEAEILSPHLGSTKVSAWIRDLNERHVQVPKINSESLEDIQVGLPDYNPREKQIKLLQNIERMTKYPGKPVQIDPEFDIPLAWASAQEEFMHYINSLIDRGFLRNLGKSGLPFHQNEFGEPIYERPTAFSVAITADGWDYLEQHERHIEDRTQAFVAMSFADDLKSIWQGPIFNAITKAGYKPYRVDAEPHSDRIDVKIMAEIKNSRFVVADVTEHKLGVYFEAGYALGLGLPVIWCVRKDHLEKAHFDTRQYNHITWETLEDLEDQLFNFICAIIGKGKVI